jgi:hypothetical protein
MPPLYQMVSNVATDTFSLELSCTNQSSCVLRAIGRAATRVVAEKRVLVGVVEVASHSE